MALEKEGEEWKEYNSAVRWMVIAVTLSIIITLFLALISMPLAYIIGNGISKESMNDVAKFFSLTFNKNGFLYHRYWVWLKQLFNYNGPFSISLWVPILPFISLPLGMLQKKISKKWDFLMDSVLLLENSKVAF